jgi:hypothetical protein
LHLLDSELVIVDGAALPPPHFCGSGNGSSFAMASTMFCLLSLFRN